MLSSQSVVEYAHVPNCEDPGCILRLKPEFGKGYQRTKIEYKEEEGAGPGMMAFEAALGCGSFSELTARLTAIKGPLEEDPSCMELALLEAFNCWL